MSRPAPRSAETGSPASVATTAAHPADPSSLCAHVWCGSRRDPRSTTQTATRRAAARTSVSAHWTPSPPELSDLALAACDRTAPPLHGEASAVRSVHRCRFYPRNLLEARMIITTYNQHVRLLSSEPFGWFAPPKFTRAWEPTLLWNHYTQNPSMSENGVISVSEAPNRRRFKQEITV